MNRLFAATAAAAAASYLAFLPMAGRAASAEACDLSQGMAALAAAENQPAGGYSLLAELNARKSLLAQTIACAKSETTALEDQLAPTVLADSSLQGLKDRFAGDLGELISYYDAQSARVPDMGIQGIKNLAQEILDWRSAYALPRETVAANFILWNQNQPLFAAAESRTQELAKAAASLSIVSQGSDMQQNLEDAQSHLKDALAANQSAEASFSSATAATDSGAYLSSSLNSLAAAYASLLKLNDTLAAILPH